MTMETDFDTIKTKYKEIMDKISLLEDDFATFNSEIRKFFTEYKDKVAGDPDFGTYIINEMYTRIEIRRYEIMETLTDMLDMLKFQTFTREEPSEYTQKTFRIRNLFRR